MPDPCRRKPLAVKLGSSIVLYSPEGKPRRYLRPEIDRYHEQFHRLRTKNVLPRSFVADFLENTMELLKCPGNTDLSLLLFLIFTELASSSPRAKELLFLLDTKLPENTSQQQIILAGLFSKEETSWLELLRNDVLAGIELAKRMRFQLAELCRNDRQIFEVISLSEEVEKVTESLGGDNRLDDLMKYLSSKYSPSTCRMFALHFEFCESKNRYTYHHLRKLVHSYSKLVQSLNRGEIPKEFFPEYPFYRELEMVNVYNLVGGDPDLFDQELLAYDCVTANEKKIRKKILLALESKRRS